jgi:hypothetical protein
MTAATILSDRDFITMILLSASGAGAPFFEQQTRRTRWEANDASDEAAII